MREGYDDLSHGLHLSGRARVVQVVPRSTMKGEASRCQDQKGRDPLLTSAYSARLPCED